MESFIVKFQKLYFFRDAGKLNDGENTLEIATLNSKARLSSADEWTQLKKNHEIGRNSKIEHVTL